MKNRKMPYGYVLRNGTIRTEPEEAENVRRIFAAYLNGKLGDLQKQVPHFDKRPSDFQYQMLVLNVADDYFKVRSQADASAEKIASMEQTLYDLKHELVTTKMQLEHAEKEASEWKSALDEQGKRLDELRESFFKHKSN